MEVELETLVFVSLLVVCHLLFPQIPIIKAKILIQMIPKTMGADEKIL